MKVLRADFAVRRPVGVWPWVALILVLGGLGGYQGWLGWAQAGRISVLRQEQENLSQKLDLVELARRKASDKRDVVPPYAADAAALVGLASFPLNRVLASLESAQVQGIKVTGLEAQAAEGTVRIDVEFADHTTLLAYLEAINAGEPTPRWVLVQAQVSTGSAAGNSATLVSGWATAGQ